MRTCDGTQKEFGRILTLLLVSHREQIDKVNRLKDETMRAIIKNSSDIVMFKEEVSKQLKHLRDFAEAN